MSYIPPNKTQKPHARSCAAKQHAALIHAVSLTFMVFFVLLLMTSAANAGGTDSAMGSVLCAIVKLVYGNLGKGLATLAVITVGVGATLGKVTWGLALTVAVGISVIFNGHVIVGYLGSGAAGCVFN